MKQTQDAIHGLFSGLGALALSALLSACASTGMAPAPAAEVSAAKPPPTASVEARPAPAASARKRPDTDRPIVAGNNETGPVAAPATPPVAVAAATTDPVVPAEINEKDLWVRIRKGFAMPELDTPLVAEKERFYLSQPAYLQRMMSRGGRYLYFIVEELERRNMPTELALLPFVESAMNPVALSSAKAAGLWQFIPSTGKAYDLNQNWWVDNRRDVVKSTRAALDYLQKIHAMHGNDWFLALASYNWGEGAVARAVKASRARGGNGDYLSLNMPAETRHYVPKLIALKNILLKAQELNLELPVMPNKPYFVTIEKTRPIDLKLAAKFAGMSVDEFVALNPAHNRPVIAASKNNEIKLPADRVDAFLEAVRKHADEKRVMASWQPYTIKPGETLAQVAERGNISEAELRRANGLRVDSRILPGTKLLAPHVEVPDETRVESFVAPRVYEAVSVPAQYHTVGRKETLPGIAARYGLSVATLKAWNGVKKSVARGMNLLVRPAHSQTVLTEESGQRQVVSSTARLSTVAATAEDAQEARSETRADGKTARAEAADGAATKPAARRHGKGHHPVAVKAPAKGVTKVASRAPGGKAKATPAASHKVAKGPVRKAKRA